MANRLNYLNPTTNNHEQQIYRLRSRVVGNRLKNAWLLEQLATRKEHQASLS
jgi:hypothetical protein